MLTDNVELSKNKSLTNNINYWKEIECNLSEEFKELKDLTLITYNSLEFIDIINFFKEIKKGEFLNVLYISLIRSYNYMKNVLNFNPLDEKRMMFIDCVSGYAFPIDEKIDEAFYHKPPQNLNEMKEIINFGIEKAKPDVIVIDSISQFINFSQATEEEQYELYDFFNKIKDNYINNLKISIILLYDSKLSISKNLPKKYINSIYRIENIKDTNNNFQNSYLKSI